ncbi:LysM peptidoglycan-binding domain-containing protein [Aliiroseovarius sp. KMU-50]|uniref:LysM peptidoglycan-binding domain-containing protein n=1 Tax=Aliiroseovarius salicola TaxID=3009082 RepID=A0ABT4W1G3_9RHOB|nr:LysM peptidoglycan-binding domain-containing protein [Aliiroseovarius sp. KMU-50]MDA5094358.1 LysM peptidoglycan-binding domain-containing protein [Aliiroseovarius sp. KMU-50]
MTSKNTPKSGAGILVAGGTALALVLAAMGWWLSQGGSGETPATADAPLPIAEVETEEAPTAAQGSTSSAENSEDTPQASQDAVAPEPQFDIVRVEPDGSAVIAGQATPGANVAVMLDGIEAGRAEADASGNFVALLSLEPSDDSRVMSLQMDGDEVQTSSTQSVIVGPIDAPVRSVEEQTVEHTDDTAVAVSDAEATETEPAKQTPASEEPGMAAASTEPKAPQVLLADQEGIKVLQDAEDGSGSATLVLDSISYDADGNVILGGRGTADANLQIYLDNTVVSDAKVDADGQWRLALPGVVPGVYTLRVDEMDPEGKLAARVETPFKREDPVQLAKLSEGSQDTSTAEPSSDTATAEVVPEPSLPTEAEAPEAQTEIAASSGETSAEEPLSSGDTASTEPTVSEVAALPTDETPAMDQATVNSETAPMADSVRPSLVTVQPGSTLWAIARDNLGEGVLYVQVFDANRNKIRNPDLIYPGQVFTVPEAN